MCPVNPGSFLRHSQPTNPLKQSDEVARSTLAKVTRRLLPFLFVLYVVCFLDRVNIGFAALQMNQELGLSPAVYGFGAGVFFLGYVLFEVPSNLVLARVGARIWIARIMITWGLMASAMMFVRGPTSLYALRFLLGAAEAGLFLLEGLPAVLLGFAVLAWLTERPEDATWLTPAERAYLVARLSSERDECGRRHRQHVRAALANGTVWRLGVVLLLCNAFGLYVLGLWLPQIVREFAGPSGLRVGLITAVPNLVA